MAVTDSRVLCTSLPIAGVPEVWAASYVLSFGLIGPGSYDLNFEVTPGDDVAYVADYDFGLYGPVTVGPLTFSSSDAPDDGEVLTAGRTWTITVTDDGTAGPTGDYGPDDWSAIPYGPASARVVGTVEPGEGVDVGRAGVGVWPQASTSSIWWPWLALGDGGSTLINDGGLGQSNPEWRQPAVVAVTYTPPDPIDLAFIASLSTMEWESATVTAPDGPAWELIDFGGPGGAATQLDLRYTNTSADSTVDEARLEGVLVPDVFNSFGGYDDPDPIDSATWPQCAVPVLYRISLRANYVPPAVGRSGLTRGRKFGRGRGIRLAR